MAANYRIGTTLKSRSRTCFPAVFQNAGAKAVVPGKRPENPAKTRAED
jgi:hypothetical protein